MSEKKDRFFWNEQRTICIRVAWNGTVWVSTRRAPNIAVWEPEKRLHEMKVTPSWLL